MTQENALTKTVLKCLVDCVNLNFVLKPNGCSLTGFSCPLLVRSTYESLLHELSYQVKVSPTISFILPEEASGRDPEVKGGCLGDVSADLWEQMLSSLSYDPDDSLLSFRPSCKRRKLSKESLGSRDAEPKKNLQSQPLGNPPSASGELNLRIPSARIFERN
ncbi:unnamed protein product [Protopolystoma xenopodis]|uniref:Uncharacterized protein n=1 Tax=Protopolystoma xenopodis TaxID=117903 RepID=A0A448X285_9PLAT|nr:unnamed protein product [Protopolystoma xenopodis]